MYLLKQIQLYDIDLYLLIMIELYHDEFESLLIYGIFEIEIIDFEKILRIFSKKSDFMRLF
jgi:hypothetical protein